MADNTTYTPGTGATIAADDVGGVLVQRVKPQHGVDGQAVDTSATNPFPVALLGEALEALEAVRTAVNALTRTIGQTFPDTAGRQRVLLDAISASLTLATVSTVTAVTTVSTVTTVTTVATLTNQTQIGGIGAAQVVPAILFDASGVLRDRISVS
jgi:nitrate/nitrite transporter NarK